MGRNNWDKHAWVWPKLRRTCQTSKKCWPKTDKGSDLTIE
jgi:hypothetical protein